MCAPVAAPGTALRKAINKALDDLKELGGNIPKEFIAWLNDRVQEPEEPLKQLFDRAGLSVAKTDHWKALLSHVVYEVFLETRGTKKSVWDDKSELQLVRAAFEMHGHAESEGRTISKAAICKALADKPEFKQIKTGRGDKRGARSPKTLLGALERALTKIETMFLMPSQRRDLEDTPSRLEEYGAILAAFRPNWRDRYTDKSARRGSNRRSAR